MLIKYQVVEFEKERLEIRLVNKQFCCEKMVWTFQYGINFYGQQEKVSVAIYECSGDINYKPIDYCPFCGEKITLERVKSIKMKKVVKQKLVDKITWEKDDEN